MAQELETILPEKVFPMNAPEGEEAPYIVYISSDGAQLQTLSGFVPLSGGSPEVHILHTSYIGLKSLTPSVISLLQSFVGRRIGDNGPLIQELSYSDPVEIFEPELRLYRCMIEFTIHY